MVSNNADIKKALADGVLYSHVTSPPLQDDPILSNPAILPESWYMNVFTEPTHEYVYRIRRNVTIEPKYGYVLIKPYSLLDVSMPRSESTRDPRKMLDFSGLPSIREIARHEGSGVRITRLPSVVSLRYTHEDNYYHTLEDILSRLAMLDKCGVDRTIPIVISKKLAERGFFQQMQKRGELARRNWVVQDDNYIDAEEVYVSRTSEGNRERLAYLAGMLDAPFPDPNKNRLIFIFRDGAKFGRGILNMEELRPILDRFHYEIVDPDVLSVADQVTLFSEARVVIGAHGAGLTNIMFRRDAPMTLFEIFPPNETPLHYYVIAKCFGHDYRFMVGTNGTGSGRQVSYHVGAEAFAGHLEGIAESIGAS